jgi:hypothetical protein
MKSYIALFICAFSLTIAAQQPAPSKVPPVPAAPQALPAPQPLPAPQAAPAPPLLCLPGSANCNPAEGGQLVNIRLDVSVIDQTGTAAAQPKTLMVVLADRAMGQTRAVYEDRSIFVDARPTVVDGFIRMSVTVKSEEPPKMMLPGTTFKGPDPILNWTNSFALLLSNAKPMVALETMDAATKRKMSIEVKATIQK